jgi:hypothetical protein
MGLAGGCMCGTVRYELQSYDDPERFKERLGGLVRHKPVKPE